MGARTALSAVLVSAAALLTPLAATPASAAAGPVLVDGFESATPAWRVAAGNASVASSTDAGSGARSLQVSYDVSAGSVELDTVATPALLPEVPLVAMNVDVYGDGSWNTLYLRLRDATGELFFYPVTAMSFRGWQTRTVDLEAPPALHELGNNDGVLDAPVSLYRLVIAHNQGGLGVSGTMRVDNIVAYPTGWTLPTSSARVFAPSAGQHTTFSFHAGSPGDWRITLLDGQRRVKSFNGTAWTPGPVTVPWDGTLDNGAPARGSVQAVLDHDTSPGDGLHPWPIRAARPNATGVAVRYEGAAPGSPAGINSFLTQQSDPKAADAQAALMEDAFIRMAREEFEWKRIEPRQGYFSWSEFDQMVEILQSHNISVLGKLVYTAPWASSAPAGTSPADVVHYPPRDVAEYAAYVRAVVHRYKDRVHVWEVWNEENGPYYWKPAPDPTAYANMLKAAYAAIKAEDPTATVVLGGTVGFDKAFLDGLRAAGAWSSFDALALHPYVAGSPDKGMWPVWMDMAAAYLQRWGDKPIWLTEFGWSTCTGCPVATSEVDQGRFLARAYLDAAARGVQGIFAYDLVERTTSATDVEPNYGLVEGGGRKKPAYEAVRRVAAALDQSVVSGRLVPGSGTNSVVSDAATTAGWAATALGGGVDSLAATTFRHGGTAGLRLTYNFSGAARGVELKRNLPIAGTPGALSVWVYGDGSASPMYMTFSDATGETFQGDIGSAGRKGWERHTLYFDGGNSNWARWGGDRDGIVDYPITLRSVFVYKGSLDITAGTIYLDDLSAHYGVAQRGVVLTGRGASEQAIYRLGSSGAVSEPVSGGRAWLHLGSAMNAVPVMGGRATVPTGPDATYLVSVPRLTATTITPNGDGVGDTTALVWSSGERSVVTEQVLDSSGTVVKTIITNGVADAGLRSFIFDGKVWNGTAWVVAANGSYVLRTTFTGPDGRRTEIQLPVQLA